MLLAGSTGELPALDADDDDYLRLVQLLDGAGAGATLPLDLLARLLRTRAQLFTQGSQVLTVVDTEADVPRCRVHDLYAEVSHAFSQAMSRQPQQQQQQQQPRVRFGVNLCGLPPHSMLAALAGSPGVRSLALCVPGDVPVHLMAPLLACHTSLTALSLDARPADALVLLGAAAAACRSLYSLTMTMHHVDAEPADTLRVIHAIPLCASLRVLRVFLDCTASPALRTAIDVAVRGLRHVRIVCVPICNLTDLARDPDGRPPLAGMQVRGTMPQHFFSTFARGRASLPFLQMLDLRFVSVTRSVAHELVGAVAMLPTLRDLRIRQSGLCTATATGLLRAIVCPGRFRRLDIFSDLDWTSAFADEVQGFARHAPSLHYCDAVGARGARHFAADMLMSCVLMSWPLLRRVDLRHWPVSSGHDSEASTPTAPSYPLHPGLGDGTCSPKRFVQAIAGFRDIRLLHTPLDLPAPAVAAMLPVLQCPRLATLDLDVPVGHPAAVALLQALPRFPVLQRLALDLRADDISLALLRKLFRALSARSLHHLKLSASSPLLLPASIWRAALRVCVHARARPRRHNSQLGRAKIVYRHPEHVVRSNSSLDGVRVPSLFELASCRILSLPIHRNISKSDVPPGLHPTDLQLRLQACVICGAWRRARHAQRCIAVRSVSSLIPDDVNALCLIEAIRCWSCALARPVLPRVAL